MDRHVDLAVLILLDLDANACKAEEIWQLNGMGIQLFQNL